MLGLLLVSINATASAQTTPKDSGLSGEWILIEQFKDETHAHRMNLEVNGNKITGKSGPNNMDYNQIREGTTVYLPVFQEGALLFMGDGHAAQGDGELTGDALETSMEFEFTVDVIREKSIGTPRAENADYLMSIGIAGSLDQALQRATTDMARWLESDLKLNSTESAMLLGFALKYDVADLVGTQVSIVAKIPKAVIAQLKRE
jgi:amidase